ncbi:GNAT family N-acetyltransferase [uncultured Desulfobacter sp.]|uniref:GNAT family N-acetyltransferase n=1 Tax=uncultured Desulfobacter sp. TaxID=240139 RepID=UPI002AA8EA9F|nr:GNAT family N-acetyltransferase [uncultured Desulfobacter sp.]
MSSKTSENTVISFSCDIIQLQSIKTWLSEEDTKTGEGFFCNWETIEKAHTENQLAVLLKDNLPISFIAYFTNEPVVRIDIAETHPDYRNKGFGRLLFENLCDKIKTDNKVVELYCSPLSSEPIWRKLGFINFPKFPTSNSKVEMFKPLINTKTPIDKYTDGIELLELWNVEPYLANKKKPIKTWDLSDRNSNSFMPIIYPAFYEWQICWRKGTEILYQDKIKYFREFELEYGNFIIID